MGILTVDLEEWFHLLDCDETAEKKWATFPSRIEEQTDQLLRLFDRHRARATFFVLGWVAERRPSLIRRIAAAGHELGSHSFAHGMVHGQTPERFREDLRRSIRAIEDAGSTRVRCYRAPGFSITERQGWAFDILLEEGVEVDSSVFPGARAHGGFRGATIDSPFLIEGRSGAALREFPITTGGIGPFRVAFAGGGYFRLLPYPVVRRLCRGNDYLMTYFHPRDFDPAQPRITGLSMVRRFRANVGLRSALEKLDRLLGERSFGPMLAASAEIDWARAPRVCV